MDNRKAHTLREDFPLLERCTYLDSAATSQKPRSVINAVTRYYEQENANIHRGVYHLSQEATLKYEDARKEASQFIGAGEQECIFTRNTTESLNLLAYTLRDILPKRKEIVLTELEHHSNLVPWQQFAARHGMKLRFIPVKGDLTLDREEAGKLITKETALLAVNHASNAVGTMNEVEELCGLAHDAGALSVVDGAQAAPHASVDVKRIGCDFYAFSGHKMLAPTGIGVLYGKEDHLEKLPPFLFGGDMIRAVSYEKATWAKLPMKFEAGTPHISGALGLGEAVRYLRKFEEGEILAWEQKLLKGAREALQELGGVKVYGPEVARSAGILSFTMEGIHPHDVAALLDEKGVCVRAGHHCAMPLMGKLGIPGTTRASFYLYTTQEDIERLIDGLKEVKGVFA